MDKSPALEVQLDVAKRFLSTLAPEGAITFQTLCTNKDAVATNQQMAWRLNRTKHGSLAEHAATLTRLNQKGACVFVMVNLGDGKGRSAQNVMKVRAIFVDLDGAPIDPVLAAAVPPSITVQSSPGRFHAYWLVKGMPVRDFKPAQQALADKFGGDKAVCDAPRLMRLPGFIHQKRGPAAVSEVLSCHPERIWDWPALADALELPRGMSLPERIPEGERNNRLYKLAVVSNKQGIPKAERLRSLLTLNAERCKPPLSEDEVEGIVERAYKAAPDGKLEVPLSLLTNPQFLELGWGEKLLLLLTYQRVLGRSEAEFALPWNDFKQHFPRERTFGTFRKRVVDAGFLKVTRNATKPKDGAKPKPALYRVA
ncbi:primase C-terminal domain-containing protein [Lysobacter sp. S4-A87]|uniref:DNA-primase RepB domain-containing protein n=1 Tax=Lysobacter sp. S4-A87 TaxID=2925843 RepID=UPI001F53788F|nr:DNA-primase RepB domain-containing protein [Lysobacter sp. S4-A87]UNK48851.1 primase C-terminal domain-containing protein [Lysobacter sp. S4-A87]